MVKINGQRVEMGEVEIQLGMIEGITTAVVKAFVDENGQTYICGYFTATREIEDSEIRNFLLKKFPSYMVPRFIIQIDSFPLTPNGKLDRKVLPEPKAEDFQKDYVAPANDTEKKICSAFESVLGVKRVGVNDDFFALGGDSIKVVMLQEELRDLELSSSEIFSKKTPKNIAGSLSVKEKIVFKDIKADAYPMTEPQLGIYLDNIKEPNSLEYNNPASMFFPNNMGIGTDTLKTALSALIESYPFMKVRAEVRDGVPCIIPVPDMEYSIEVVQTDITDSSLLIKDFIKPFDMAKGPLFRFGIYKTPSGIYLLNDIHHLIVDGTSTSVFFNNLARLIQNESAEPEQVNGFMLCTYEQEIKSSAKFEESKKFFDNMLAGVEIDSNIIADEIEKKDITQVGRQMVISLKDHIPSNLIEQKTKELGITENTLFLSAFSYALAKQSGQEQALFCTVENGRHIPELKNTFGMLVRTLPLCIKIDENSPIKDYQMYVQDLLFNALDNDLCSIVRLAPEYEVNSDIIFVYQGEMLNGVTVNGDFIPYEIYKTGDAMSKLSLDVLKRTDDYTLSFEYRGDLYLDETIENFANLYINIIKGMLKNEYLQDIVFADKKVKDFYREANNNTCTFDRKTTIVDMFRQQAEKHPDNKAIIFKDRVLTYKELDRLSEILAQHLTRAGVTIETPVGIMVKRSEIFPVCTLAVLKAGGVCQPLDSNYPEDRLLYMLEDSKAPVVIADDGLAPIINKYDGTIISANTIQSLEYDETVTLTPPKAENLFALIYTSGSTGKPKGCMLEHRNLVNFCISFCKKFNVTSEDRAAAYGAFGFDASMQDLYPYITCGASVCIVPEETRLDLVGLNDLVLKNKITMMDCTTQLGRQFITAYPNNPYMRVFTVGGEKLVPCTPPNYNFVNTYGPTECTIYVTDYYIDKKYESVPIGKSFGNCDVYIVDKQNRLLPPGAVGELVISGYPVTRGYLNRPDLTKEKFIHNPFFDTDGYERMYLTGDVCRYLANGNIQFVGRRDEQVKIRGFRIELTEIERRIREFENIRDASVIARDLPSGGKAVVAYIVSDKEIDVKSLNAFIADELPKYMVPTVTMQIDKIPLNPNGKVDKRKLPEPKFQRKENSEPHIMNALEKQLVDVISEITGISEFNISDSLVSSGLTSLTTIMFSARLFDLYGIKPNVNELMDDKCSLITVENLIIEHLLSSQDSLKETPSCDVKISDVKLCAEQLGVYYDTVKRPADLVYNIPMMYTFPKTTDAEKLALSVERVIKASPVLSSRIVLSGKDIVQKQIENFDVKVDIADLDDREVSDFAEKFVLPFDLSSGPLFKAKILKTQSRVILLFDVHHIVFDGLSLSSFIQRIADVYENDTNPETDISYYNFIAEEEKTENSEKAENSIKYYNELFSEYESASDIAPDIRGKAENGKLQECKSTIDKVTVEEFCRNNGVTPASLFLASLEYTISRCIASRDVYISMISNGRENIEYSEALGMFVKNIPLHGKIKRGISAKDFVNDTAKAMHTAIVNSAYPFIKMFDKYNFISNINYACQLGVDKTVKINGEDIIESVIMNPLPKFNLSIHIEENENDIIVNVQYNDALYSREFMNSFSSAIASCAKNIIENSDTQLVNISLLNRENLEKINSFRNTAPREIKTKLFHRLFEKQAEINAQKTALVACDNSFTYNDLNREMNKLSHSLVNAGVNSGDNIAILLPRTSRLIIAMYGVMKAGGAYIPCDPEYPKDRINYIIENSSAKYIITDIPHGFDNELYVEDLLSNDDVSNPDTDVKPDNTAYMIYTSGSTGKPKGVIIAHKSIANYLTPYKENAHVYAVKELGNVMVSVTTASFDMSLKETAVALANGLTLVLASEDETKNPSMLVDLFSRTSGDVFSATPSRMEQYMALPSFCDVLAKCKVIMNGGEKYSPKLLNRLQGVTKARIFNTYGPTEITVSCNAMDLTYETEVCVGRPLLNVNEYIVDVDENLLPVGFIGELYVGGAGVAKGYLNNPELTAKSFKDFNGEHIYKTGDYARWTQNGNVVILGRTDNQVKLRGLRIELGEVEKAVLSCPGVIQAVILIKNIRSVEHLCAYYVTDSDVTEEELKAFISKSLTKYMVPTAYCRLDAMPLTPNGKTDVKRLPNPEIIQSSEYVEPATPDERVICNIYSDILRLDRVSAVDSFFDLGGTSLTVTSLIVELNEKGYEVSYGDVFTLKTPRAIAEKLSNKNDFAYDLTQYDYSVFDNLLKANNLKNFKKDSNSLGNVLLTGATGFLGIHILYRLIENYSGKIYCLLRSRRITAEDRLRVQLFYYFEENYSNLFGDRIIVIDGDVTDDKWFDKLKDEEINTVINCAALVKHFSNTDDIERINVGGVENLISFSKQHNSMLVQVSTQSIAGDRVNNYPSSDLKLTEDKLYFGQAIDNQYVHSKFMGERKLLEAINGGLRGKIMRVGNLAARDSDGEFQINFTTNGFMGRLKAYLAIGAFPYSSMNYPVEMAPIEETADAILRLISTPDECCIFHPFNNHYVPLGDIILQMKRMGFDIALAEDSEFSDMLNKAQQDKKRASLLTTLLAYENKDSSKKVEMIGVDNEYTTQVLYRLGFEWSMTSRNYMNKFLESLYGLGFFMIDRKDLTDEI